MKNQCFNKQNLSEQVNEVCKSTMSKDEKCKALIKLGFTPYECEFVLRTNQSGFGFTFGVEIECLMMRSRLVEAARANGMPYQYEGYNHSDNHSHYKFVTDASISGADGIECVSPILNGNDEGFNSLKNCCMTLNEAGACVNRSTGLHVHIGVKGMSDIWFINIFANYQKLERVIDTFMAHSRRDNNNGYCKSLQGFNFTNGCNTIGDVQNTLSSRYFKVNPMSIRRHGTIEFRQHQGTTDFEKISNWVRFVAKLVEWSAKNVLNSAITTIDEIPFINESEKLFFKTRAAALR